MGLIEEILEVLTRKTLNYKGIRVNLLGIPQFRKYSTNSLSGTLAYMRKKGLLEGEDLLRVTRRGREYVKRKYDSLPQFNFKFEKDAPKDLIVMYDIPEGKKAEREWLRWHLKKFQYMMIQKSVWVGPSPLPKDFVDYMAKIKLKENLKTFKLAKDYKLLNK